MAIDLTSLVIHIIVNVIILAPVLWLVGRGLVGKQKAKGTDAIWIVILGVVVQNVVASITKTAVQVLSDILQITLTPQTLTLASALVGLILTLLLWLFLIQHFFDCGFLMAFAIAVVTVIAFIIISVVIGALLGLGLLFLAGII